MNRSDSASGRIPVYQPQLSGNERKYVLDCIDSNWISSKGKYVAKFERAFAHYLGVKHAISVCNGTTAVHLSLPGCLAGFHRRAIDFAHIRTGFDQRNGILPSGFWGERR